MSARSGSESRQRTEHLGDGYLIVRLEPGDFIVKRVWSTAVVPYIYNTAEESPDE